jgi:hypothetical protein
MRDVFRHRLSLPVWDWASRILPHYCWQWLTTVVCSFHRLQPPFSLSLNNIIQWVSALRRLESRESTELDMVLRSEKLSEKWKCPSTRPTVAYSAERTLWSVHALESGNADLATKLLPEEPTLCQLPVESLFAVPLAVYEECNKRRPRWLNIHPFLLT